MTVTIIVEGKVWFQGVEVTDITLWNGDLTVSDAKGQDHSVNIVRVDSMVVTDY